jgi:hypothetical protein
MNPYSSMLKKAVDEIRQYQQNRPDAKHMGEGWLEGLAKRLEHASSVSGIESAELEILTIARMDVDSGPCTGEAMPSFNAALDAVQRKHKRLRRIS